jgi:hypothetical protein
MRVDTRRNRRRGASRTRTYELHVVEVMATAQSSAQGVGLQAELRVKETMATNNARSTGEVEVEPD